MANKIVFIPFADVEGQTPLFLNFTQWKDAKKNVYECVCYDDTSTYYPIHNATAATQIYVLGHGAPGLPKIKSGTDVYLKFNHLADRLVECGLKESFAGSIKIHACNSADKDGKQKSFAKLFAEYLVKTLKRHQCRVFGYHGLIDQQYGSDYIFAGRKQTSDRPHRWTYENGNEVRASERRKQVYPKWGTR